MDEEIRYPVFLTEDQILSLMECYDIEGEIYDTLGEVKKHIESDKRGRSPRPGRIWRGFLGC